MKKDFWLFFEGNAWELKHVYWLKKGTSRQRKVKYTQKVRYLKGGNLILAGDFFLLDWKEI